MSSGKRVYVSAPITGYDLAERREYFSMVARKLVVNGYFPVVPTDNGVDIDADVTERMREYFRLLLTCDMILLCEGWEESDECQKEASLSLWSGIPLFDGKSIGL